MAENERNTRRPRHAAEPERETTRRRSDETTRRRSDETTRRRAERDEEQPRRRSAERDGEAPRRRRPEEGERRQRSSREDRAAAREAAKAAEKRREERARQRAEEEREAKRRARQAAAKRRRAAWGRFLHGLKITLIVLLILVLVLGGAATAGGYFVTKSQTILPNVYLDGVNVGKMTPEAAMGALADAGWETRAATPLTVTLPAGHSFTLDRVRSGAMLSREVAVEAAYRYGHGANWYENLLRYLMSLVKTTDVIRSFAELDETYIRETAEAAVQQLKADTADGDYSVDKDAAELRMLKGGGQLEIDLDRLCTEIKAALSSGQSELDHNHIDKELTPPDFEAIFTELHIKPVDAHYVEGGFDVVDEIVGCSFDVDEALRLWEQAAPGEEVLIPLQISYPEVTGEDLRGRLFRDKLGEQITLFGGSTAERVNNIQLAASRLNGVILQPGDVLSYNQTVGERTVESGFKYAAAYADGEVVQEIGGGVCQVSSTLYCACMYANLETVEREAHYFMVNYLPWGHDATVSWPSPDFKCRNTRNYPVKIVAEADPEALTLTIQVWGTDEDGSYVEITYDRYFFTYEGTEDIAGWNVYTYRNIYDKDGNLIETIEEPQGTYHKHEDH